MTEQIDIRKMTQEDALGVFAIENAVAISPWGAQLFADCVGVGYDCWVMTEADRVIGFAVLSYAAGEASILNFGIAPDKQHQGLGRRMLQYLIDRVKSLGAVEVFLEVRRSNLIAQQLYKKFDFIEVGVRKDYYPTGDKGEPQEDGLTMVKKL